MTIFQTVQAAFNRIEELGRDNYELPEYIEASDTLFKWGAKVIRDAGLSVEGKEYWKEKYNNWCPDLIWDDEKDTWSDLFNPYDYDADPANYAVAEEYEEDDETDEESDEDSDED